MRPSPNPKFEIRNSIFAIVLLFLLLPACASYELQGHVVQGPRSQVELVDPDDPRLNQPGIEDARVLVRLDPGRPGARTLGQAASDRQGRFTIPIDEFGAGVLEYDVGLFIQRNDFEGLEHHMRLPPSGKRLLISLTPGDDDGTGRHRDVLEETFEWAEPYMD